MNVGFEAPAMGEVEGLLKSMVGRRILVVGDILLDGYLMGTISRISPDAPVPVVAIEREEYRLGGAANVAKALAALGAQVRLAGVVGEDQDGEFVVKEVKGLGIDVEGVLTDKSRPTSVKRRVVAQQQVIRLDWESNQPLDQETEGALIEELGEMLEWCEGVILSDYLKGVLSERVCRFVIENAKGRVTLVDPKGRDWDRYRGVTVLKPNMKEAGAFLRAEVNSDLSAEISGRELLEKVHCEHALITRDEKGMTLISRAEAGAVHFRARCGDVADVTGAGDVVAATLMLALAAGARPVEAVWLSNVAAGVKVAKFGAAEVGLGEILGALGGGGRG
jgi:D-beta-D-heptose 7-phosphate kinase / D-beta-D-heptose 1-phosphate adenosyltransferase